MGFRRHAGVLTLVTGLAVTAALGGPATAASAKKGGDGVSPVATGLSGPFGIDSYRDGFLVAEGGAGQVTYVDHKNRSHVLLEGAGGVAGVAGWGGYVYSVLGGPNEEGEPAPGDFEPTSVLRTNPRTGQTTAIADLEDYELANNPDGQVQFVNGVPVDALSNPFAMAASPIGLLVADGGANDVLLVDPRTGRVSTFFVPPTVSPAEVPPCAENENNPGTVGCDSVPTGVAIAHGNAYISTLGAFGFGAGRIYQVDLRTRKVERVWGGLFAPTGVAVGRDGSIYYSRVITDEVIRIAPGGAETSATVGSPTGLTMRGNRLYSSSGAFAPPGAGQVVQVGSSAFQ